MQIQLYTFPLRSIMRGLILWQIQLLYDGLGRNQRFLVLKQSVSSWTVVEELDFVLLGLILLFLGLILANSGGLSWDVVDGGSLELLFG